MAMIFTRLGQLIAWLAVLFGTLRAGMGFSIASSENYQALATRYLGTSTGEAINQGLMMFVFGIALGILTDISRSLQR
jgi:hypothetical protein